MKILWGALILWMSMLQCAAFAADWPQWRGLARDGIAPEKGWFKPWPNDGPKILWKRKVGEGYATPSTTNGLVFVIGNEGHKDTIYCLQARSGEEVWKYSYSCPPGGSGFPGPAAAPTIHEGKVYVLSRVGHLHCLDANDGKLIWKKAPEEFQITRVPRPWHGSSSHPLIEGDLLLLEMGGEKASVVALDKNTGALRWQSGDEKLGYASPMVATIDGKRTLVVFSGSALIGLNVSDGKLLWRYPCDVDFQCAIASPVIDGNKIFISSLYWPTGSALLEVKNNKVQTLWENRSFRSHTTAGVLWKGYLYGFNGSLEEKERLLQCVDASTGKIKWSQSGLGIGGLLVADDKLVILSENGELLVAKASPEEFTELARAQILGGQCWNMPVLSNGLIYVRNHKGDLACVDPKN